MKRKKSQKRTAKSRKKPATEKQVLSVQEPVILQSKKYANVEISLVNFKTPRRNVKPPKKYADEDFIYYNNGGPDEFGIDPALLCECALDTSDPSVSEDKLNSSEITETASENGDDIADLSKLCETVLITSGPADTSGLTDQSTEDGYENLAESEDDFVDVSKMCQAELITSDPNDPQTVNNGSVKAGNSEEEFILGLSDGELDFASSMRNNEKGVSPKKTDKNQESSKLQKTKKDDNTTVPKRKAKRRSYFTSRRRRRKKKNTNLKTTVQENKANIPTESTSVNVDLPMGGDVRICSEKILGKEVPATNPDNNGLMQVDKVVCSENILSKEVPKVNPDNDCLMQVDKVVCSENILSKEVPAVNPDNDCLMQVDKVVCSENILSKEVPAVNPDNDCLMQVDKVVCSENILSKEVPVINPDSNCLMQVDKMVCSKNIRTRKVPAINPDNNCLMKVDKVVCSKNIRTRKVPITNPDNHYLMQVDSVAYSDNVISKEALELKPDDNHLGQNEENVTSGEKLEKGILTEKPNADHSTLDLEQVRVREKLEKDILVEKTNTDCSTLDLEKVSSEEKLACEILLENPNVDHSTLDLEQVDSGENLDKEIMVEKPDYDHSSLDHEKLDNEEPEVNSLAKNTKDLTITSGEETLSTRDEVSKQLMAVDKHLEESSVPDIDSGCDVDMEQGCEEDEHLNVDDSGGDDEVAVNQVPYFNETRIVKVLLHRLEDEEFFSVWKEGKRLPESAVLDSSTLSPTDDIDQKVSSEVILTISKSKKKNKSNKKPKKKPVRCTDCKRKFHNDSALTRHRGSKKCFVTFECRKCFAKFKSVDRLLEHSNSSCNTERVFACNVCGKSYAFKHHLEVHQNPVCRSLKANKCTKCNKQFSSSRALTNHLAVHGTSTNLPRSQPNQYLCEICGAMFQAREKFQLHKETHIEILTVVCKQCGKGFKTARKLKKHMKTHSNESGQYTCAECGKSFTELKRLRTHLAVHGMMTSLKQLECKICKKICGTDRNLKIHMKSHSVIKENSCSKCNAKFDTFEELKEHLTVCGLKLKIKIKNEENLSLKEEKPHVCHICGKSFSLSQNLKRHSVMHRNQNTALICDICGKMFKSTFHLSQHKLMVSCNVSSTNYFCRECGKEYMDFPGLKMHFIEAHNMIETRDKKSHVKCDKCGKEYEDHKKLRAHSITHREGYWSSCNYCGKVITKRSLKTHICQVSRCLNALSDNTVSEVKVEPIIKMEDQPNIPNDRGTVPVYSRLVENAKPKPSFNSHSEKNLLPCRFCGRILGSRCSLKRHVLNVHKSSSTTEGLSSSLLPKAEPPLIKVEEQTPVQIENLSAPSRNSLIETNKQTIPKKIEINGLPCGMCGKVLAHSRSLRRHMSNVHKVSTNSATSHVVPKVENPFNVYEPPQLNLDNENCSLSERYCNQIKAVELQNSGSTDSGYQIPSMAEHQISIHITSMQVPPELNNQSYRSISSNINTSPQTEQLVPEGPNSVSGLSQSDYQTSEVSTDDNIFMSEIINAQNYKMYLPNTSFLNSQCQNIESNLSSSSTTTHDDTKPHQLNTQLPQTQQNHYPSIENNSILPPTTYLSHDVPTPDVNSLPIPEFIISKATGNTKLPSSNQYPISESIINVHPTSLLGDKHLDLIDNIMCSPPPPQAINSNTLMNIPIDEPLTQQHDNIQELNASTQTAPSISYSYFITPGCPEISQTMACESKLTTDTSLPVCYQSPEMTDINIKIIQQKVPLVTSTNTYYHLHQYVKPEAPIQTTATAQYQIPGSSNTFILVQPKLVPESQNTSNTIISKASSSNQFIKKVETRSIELRKNENLYRIANVNCSICKSSFYSKEELNKHLIVHGLEASSTHYRCTTCDQLFELKYKYRAEEHLRIHTGEKPFPCNKCSERFRTNSLLNKHSLNHSKVPITCSVCRIALSSNYSLRRHLKTVHKITITTTPEAINKVSSTESVLEKELTFFINEEKTPIQSEPVEPLLNLQQPYVSREPSVFRDTEELTSSHSYSYGFEESSGNHSDIALDLNDLRDDFVPDAMETVLKLENW